MNWIEVVQLRTAERNHDILESRLIHLAEEIKREHGPGSIMVYKRSLIPTDFSIQIVHNSGKVEDAGSLLGLQLVAALKEFGLVNHSVWMGVTPRCYRHVDIE
jgi:hypothetical protein